MRTYVCTLVVRTAGLVVVSLHPFSTFVNLFNISCPCYLTIDSCAESLVHCVSVSFSGEFAH